MRAVLAGLVLALFTLPALAAPDIVLTGTLTGADNQTYKSLPFTVPDGIARLTVRFSYTGKEQHTTIDLGLFDPNGFRGWSGGNKDSFTLSATDATPSYLPGPLTPGVWHLVLGVPNIRKDATATYEARISFARESDAPQGSAFSDAPLRAGPAWYRGDLHMHTAQSDGSCASQSGRKVPCPLYKTVEAAAARGLDFIAISDHNTVSQFNEMRELQPYFDHLLLIPAREITSFHGHANVYGPTAFIDFRLGSQEVPNLDALLSRVEALHGLIAINHPALPSGEICMGCGWTMPDTDYNRIQAVEIVNGGALALTGAADGPVSGIPFWEALLDKGYRLTGIGGSDNHDATAQKNPVGKPVTAVYAPNLSDAAILAGIRAGHVFLDIDGTTSRLLELEGHAGAATAIMGDSLRAPRGQRLAFTAHITGASGAVLEIVEDGRIVAGPSDAPLASNDSRKSVTLTGDGGRHWLLAQVREGGRLILIGNPIYLNP